jgi:hypothetical protein
VFAAAQDVSTVPFSRSSERRCRRREEARAKGLHAGEDDRTRAASLDDLTRRRQHPVRLVDPEGHDLRRSSG